MLPNLCRAGMSSHPVRSLHTLQFLQEISAFGLTQLLGVYENMVACVAVAYVGRSDMLASFMAHALLVAD